jgi:aspartate racemase
MKSIGLIGGMSWESTALYYQAINRAVSQRRGGLCSADIHLRSLNFETIVTLQKAGDWQTLTDILSAVAFDLEQAGAECVLICTNTMHRVAPAVQANLRVPLLHIADITGEAIRRSGVGTVALLGTQYTMEQTFYLDRLALQGIKVVVPPEAHRKEVHRIIFDELCRGEVIDDSRRNLVDILSYMVGRGAEGLVLGCTELSMILGDSRMGMPVFDTTVLHAEAAVDFALATATEAHG